MYGAAPPAKYLLELQSGLNDKKKGHGLMLLTAKMLCAGIAKTFSGALTSRKLAYWLREGPRAANFVDELGIQSSNQGRSPPVKAISVLLVVYMELSGKNPAREFCGV